VSHPRLGSSAHKKRSMNAPNPKLPGKSRLYTADFTVREAIAHYTSDASSTINRFLREGGTLEAADLAIHMALQRAFSDLEPFDKPIKVFRAVNLGKEPTKLFVQDLLNAWKEGRMVEFAGYQSCTTNKKASILARSPILLVVKAVAGLDVRPVSASPFEDELLLNHGSSFDVTNIRWPPRDRQIVVKLEQIQ
jgi:ADP-ribosyltransferase exoenzyme